MTAGIPMKRRMGFRSETSLSETQWIEQNFQKRECIKFIRSVDSAITCVCGRAKTSHPPVAEGVVRVTYPAEKWNVLKHTELSPTDAYGTIEFQGGPHPTKAQYIRLSYDTKPDKILTLLHELWGLMPPKLLISVHGGIANFDLQLKLRRVWRQGLLKAAKTTGAWIVTGGTNTGVMKHVGDALGDTLIQSRSNIVTLGIVPWGIVHKKQELVGTGGSTSYHAMAAPTSNNVILNNNHSYFLLSDDGTVNRIGYEAILRKKLEKYISQQTAKELILSGSRGKNFTTPVVYLILEGGCNTIRLVLDCVMETPPFPVVIVDGSGRAADLLAFAHKYASDDGTMPEALRDQLLVTIRKTFTCSTETAEKTFIELMMCMKNKKHLMTVFRIQEQMQDIDRAILAALLKSQDASAPDQLNRALTWDRVDIAKSHIFVYGQDWPEGALDQAMMDALVNNRVDFVKLLIENGVNMSKWLTIERLEELYNLGLSCPKFQPIRMMFTTTRHQSDASMTLKHLLKEIKMHTAHDYRYTLLDIGQVINKLMKGSYRSTYCRKKFRTTYYAVMNKFPSVSKVLNSVPSINPLPPPSNTFRYPYSELMVWAVLLQRQKMALFMWERGEEALAKALVACRLYKSLAHEAEEDELEVDVANELRRYAQDFANLAIELLDHCFKTDDDLTQLLLTYELSNWSDQTCMSLATTATHRPFIASTGCQIVMTEMWMGGLRTRKYANLKVIFGILVFPFILFMNYRSVEELQLMPQTVEEHIQDQKGGVSDSDSDNDSDADSVVSHRSAESQRRPKETAQLGASNHSLNSVASAKKTSLNPPLEAFALQKRQSPLRLGKKIYEFYTAPITKFWMHAMSYTVFMLAFNYIMLIQTPAMPSWVEWYIIAYMAGWVVEKFREIAMSEGTSMHQKLRIFFTDLWNIFDTLILILFFVGLGMRFTPHLVLHARAFYCMSVALCITRILDLFAVSLHLGPFVHIIGKMMKELLYFVVFLLIALTAFGTFRQSLWFPYNDFDWGLVRDIFLKPYFMLYGEVYADEIWPECGNVTEPVAGIYFPCVPGRWLVPAAMSIFLIIGIVLLLSVLIAVFNNVFNRNYLLSNQVWKYQRYILVIEYESKPILPSPLIILCHLYLLAKYLRRKWLNKKKFLDNGLKCFLDDSAVERLHDFEEECMEIYYREKENKHAVSVDERMRTTVERLENIYLRIDDINQKENSIRSSLGTLEGHIMMLENATLHTSQALLELQKFLAANVPEIASESRVTLDDELESSASDLLGTGLPISGDLREFNEKKLGPFTEYQKFQRCRGIFCRNHSLLSPGPPQFQKRGCVPRRTRHNSCSACPTRRAAEDGEIKQSQRPELRVQFSLDVDKGSNVCMNSALGRGFTGGRDVVDGRLRSFSRPHTIGTDLLQIPSRISMLTSPLSPIITPIRTEYTSITDDIDTSSVTHRSPPSTPTVHPWVYQAEGKRKKTAAAGRKRKRPLPNDQLKKAEETVHKQMEFIVHKRIRQLSLTETESAGNLAKHALESLEDGSEEDEEDGMLPLHHSDDEMTSSGVSTGGNEGGLKPIKSEPVLKKHQRRETGADLRSSELEVIVDVHEDRAGGGISENIVTSEEAISFNFEGNGMLGRISDNRTSLADKRPSNNTDGTVSFTIGKDHPSPTISFNAHSNSSC